MWCKKIRKAARRTAYVPKRNRQQTTAARTKQHEDEEEDTGIRHKAGREKIREQREKHGKTKQNKQDNKSHRYRFHDPLIELNHNKQKLPLPVGFRAIVAHVPLINPIGTLPHDLPFRFCSRRQLYQYGCPPPPRFPFLPPLASCGGTVGVPQ